MGNSDVYAQNSYTNITKNTGNTNLSSIFVDEMKTRAAEDRHTPSAEKQTVWTDTKQ